MALEGYRERVRKSFKRPTVHREKLFARHACLRYCAFRVSNLSKRVFKIPWLQVDLVSRLQTFLSGSRRLACERRSTETIVQLHYNIHCLFLTVLLLCLVQRAFVIIDAVAYLCRCPAYVASVPSYKTTWNEPYTVYFAKQQAHDQPILHPTNQKVRRGRVVAEHHHCARSTCRCVRLVITSCLYLYPDVIVLPVSFPTLLALLRAASASRNESVGLCPCLFQHQ
jgi:hypothetical protein